MSDIIYTVLYAYNFHTQLSASFAVVISLDFENLLELRGVLELLVYGCM